ncbi:MAG: geranylgeranyl reductase family protein [FCB group bacterium]|nr:geranylgeranyl reductase family protein [FCB group bacterium]
MDHTEALKKELKQFSWQDIGQQTSRRIWDVVIVGAGPAGAMAAISLAKEGHRVLLVDRAVFPRDKVCGDSIIDTAGAYIEKIGLSERFQELSKQLAGIRVFSPSGVEFTIYVKYFTIKRKIFDALLVQKAIENKVTFAQGQIVAVDENDDDTLSFFSRHSSLIVKARFGIIATGANIGLARKLKAVTTLKPDAIAMRCYAKSSLIIDHIILSYDKHIIPGYGWIIPLGNNEYNLGCGIYFQNKSSFNLQEQFRFFITHFPLAKELLKKGEIITPLRGAALRCGLRGVKTNINNKILLTGETIGATFPFSGEGIVPALETGEMAASAVHQYLTTGNRRFLDNYTFAINSQLKPKYKGFEIAQKWVSYSWLSNFMAYRIKKSKYLRNVCAACIAKKADPREVYSLKGILNSFIK